MLPFQIEDWALDLIEIGYFEHLNLTTLNSQPQTWCLLAAASTKASQVQWGLIFDSWADNPSAACDLVLKHASKVQLSESLFSQLAETVIQKKGVLQTKAVNCLFELLNVKAAVSC